MGVERKEPCWRWIIYERIDGAGNPLRSYGRFSRLHGPRACYVPRTARCTGYWTSVKGLSGLTRQSHCGHVINVFMQLTKGLAWESDQKSTASEEQMTEKYRWIREWLWMVSSRMTPIRLTAISLPHATKLGKDLISIGRCPRCLHM